MTGRLQSVIAVALALSVLAILVSPFAASEITTVHTPQKVRPTVVAIPLALYAPLGTWFNSAPAPAIWQAEEQLVLPGSEIIRLTTARLC